MSVPTAESSGQPKGRNWLIVIVAVVVFCCLSTLCCALIYYFYTSGDSLFGLAARLAGTAI